MTKFKDYDEVSDKGKGSSNCLELPFGGQIFTITSPPARVGLRVQAFMQTAVDAAAKVERGEDIDLDDEALQEAEELDLYREVLGAAYEDMEFSLTIEQLKHAALTTMVWIAFDRDRAVSVWEGKDLNAAAKKSVAANTTQKPVSTNGTSQRQGRNRRRRRAGSRSRGRPSSTGGSS